MSDTGTDTEVVEETEAPAVDDAREAMVAELRAAIGDALVEHHIVAGRDVWVRVTSDSWFEVMTALRHQLGYDLFDFLSGIDWMIPAEGRYEDTPFDRGGEDDEASTSSIDEGTGYAGGDTRFQIFARVYSTRRLMGITIKADLDEAYPEVRTVSSVYAGADWHERECWEMFGFNFVGHPHLVHLYLPGDFEGFPLRKDYPLLARVVKPWPGVVDVEPIPEHLEEELERQIMEAAEAEAAGDSE